MEGVTWRGRAWRAALGGSIARPQAEEREGLGEWSLGHVLVQSSPIIVFRGGEVWEEGGGAASTHSGRVVNGAVRMEGGRRGGTGTRLGG